MSISEHIYVDANAAIEGNGTKECPFSSVEAAKEYVKSLDKTNGDIVVEIADGYYELSETLVFDESDSGNENCRIRYTAANGATPVLSGGKKITGEWTSEGGGIYSINLDRAVKLRSLYVNGERAYMTSKVIKVLGGYGKYEIEADSDEYAWISGSETAGVKFSLGSIPLNTRNADDIELMTQTTWNTTIVCADKLELKGLNVGVRLQMPYGAIAQTLGLGNEYQFKNNNMVYNVFEWLDEPGEFYFDKTEKKLYYYPKGNEDIKTAEIIVPQLEKIIEISGTNLKSNAGYLSFEGLTFAYTDWNLHCVNGSYGRATNQGAAALNAYAQEFWHDYIYRAYDVGPASICISSANNVILKGNTVCHTGNDGISVVNDVKNLSVIGNIVYDTGGTALLIGHPQHEYIGDKNSDKGLFSDREKYDADTEGVCKNLNVSDNLFKNTCRLFWGDSGVMVYFAQNLDFCHNQIENTPYSGISLGWGWWNMNGSEESVVPNCPSETMRSNKITNNRFINTITTLSDAGAIYTIGDMPDTVISENYIKTIGSGKSATYHIRGIHIDEGTKNVYGEKNVIDIEPEFACIDCGDWGNKGNNRWDNNYSTSPSYTTTGTYEPNTVITNAHLVINGQWNQEALDIIELSGIREEYKKAIPKKILTDAAEIIQSIPNETPQGTQTAEKIAIAVASAAGAAILTAAAVKIIKRIKKKKR